MLLVLIIIIIISIIQAAPSLNNCSICLEEIDSNRIAHLDGCGHLFHADCMAPWFTLDPEQGENRRWDALSLEMTVK